jgi:DUF4097 and DUF4098 domain-containing protein YvlB
MTTVSGDAEVAAVGPVEVSANTTSGDIEVSAPMFDELRLRTVSGDMDVAGGFSTARQHTVESVSGDLSIESASGLTVDVKRGLDLAKGANRPFITGDGSARLRFRSLSGDVQVSASRQAGTFSGTQPPAEPAQEVKREDSIEILRALERGEIDVEEASRRLEGAANRG